MHSLQFGLCLWDIRSFSSLFTRYFNIPLFGGCALCNLRKRCFEADAMRILRIIENLTLINKKIVSYILHPLKFYDLARRPLVRLKVVDIVELIEFRHMGPSHHSLQVLKLQRKFLFPHILLNTKQVVQCTKILN